MNAKKIVAVLALTLMTALTVAKAAPKDGGPPMGPMRPLDRLSEAADKVQMTDEVKTKVHEVITDAQGKAQAIIDDAKAAGKDKDARAAAREKIKDLVKETKTNIEALFSDEQKVEFNKALKELRPTTRPTEPGKHGNGEGRGGKKGGKQ